jgi:hypothetical protein
VFDDWLTCPLGKEAACAQGVGYLPVKQVWALGNDGVIIPLHQLRMLAIEALDFRFWFFLRH